MATFVLVHGAGDAGWYWHLAEAAVQEQARLDGGKTGSGDPFVAYYDGVPRPLAEEAVRRGGRGESTMVWDTPWPLDAWPDVPTRFILGTDDRCFPAPFLRQLARQRLGIVADEIPGCHCVALSRPGELAELLAGYLR
jgi:pimeloyl-ACP methyl ester carboxylesterase